MSLGSTGDNKGFALPTLPRSCAAQVGTTPPRTKTALTLGNTSGPPTALTPPFAILASSALSSRALAPGRCPSPAAPPSPSAAGRQSGKAVKATARLESVSVCGVDSSKTKAHTKVSERENPAMSAPAHGSTIAGEKAIRTIRPVPDQCPVEKGTPKLCPGGKKTKSRPKTGASHGSLGLPPQPLCILVPCPSPLTFFGPGSGSPGIRANSGTTKPTHANMAMRPCFSSAWRWMNGHLRRTRISGNKRDQSCWAWRLRNLKKRRGDNWASFSIKLKLQLKGLISDLHAC